MSVRLHAFICELKFVKYHNRNNGLAPNKFFSEKHSASYRFSESDVAVGKMVNGYEEESTWKILMN